MALAEELKTSVEIEGIKVKPRSVLASGSRRCSHILEENLKEFGVLFFFMFEQYFGKWYFIHTCLSTKIFLFPTLCCNVRDWRGLLLL